MQCLLQPNLDGADLAAHALHFQAHLLGLAAYLLDLLLQPQLGLVQVRGSRDVGSVRPVFLERPDGVDDQAEALAVVGGLGDLLEQLQCDAHA